jgi:two-component system CheB/CheR fusion protein
MAHPTARSSAGFAEQFGARVQALVRCNALVVDQDWKGVALDKLIETMLAPFIAIDPMRVEMMGPPVTMAAGAVQVLGLALHELAANASRWGALSAPGGKVVLSWGFENGGGAPDAFRMEWREQGGPPVNPVMREGFGRFIAGQLVTRALGASVNMDFASDGLRWTVQMPAGGARSAQRG